MCRTFDPFRLLLFSIAGWLGQQQRDAINYLREENRVLREQLGGERFRLNDDQPRRLAAKAKVLGRRLLREVATIVKNCNELQLGGMGLWTQLKEMTIGADGCAETIANSADEIAEFDSNDDIRVGAPQRHQRVESGAGR